VEGDLLATPNKYFYSQFHGKKFIEYYSVSRKGTLDTLPQGKFAYSIDIEVVEGIYEREIVCSELYKSLISLVAKGLFQHDELLDKCVQRFEVTKRQFDVLDKNWRPISKKAYRDYSIYLEFGLLMAVAYEMDSSLPKLNALLKVVDSIVSVQSNLSLVQQANLAHLISREMSFVMDLARKTGVTTGEI
jgi:hypothetical protein